MDAKEVSTSIIVTCWYCGFRSAFGFTTNKPDSTIHYLCLCKAKIWINTYRDGYMLTINKFEKGSER